VRIPAASYRLQNGLLVTLSEDHSTPIVAVNVWYHVGSANEPEGRTGFAHLFEHMLFQGSAHVEANEHFELIERAGGTVNGSTWLDRTNYFETLPSNQLALGLWLEADRMGALLPAMTQEKLDAQRDVVKNERRWSVDNQPYGTWWERLPALAFPSEHPFHHSLIGSFEDLSAASLDDVTQFFRTFYTPDNAALTIAGDFDTAEVRALVERYFGPIPRGAEKPPLRATEVARKLGGTQHTVVEDDVMVPRVYLAFRSPCLALTEYYPASVCAAVLGMRRGSRLHRALVRERQLASDASAFTFDLSKGSDLLIAVATARPGVRSEELEAALTGEIDLVHTDGVTKSEVERAVALIETDYVSAMQSAAERADRLSQFATYFGDASLVNTQIDRYRATTADDVTRFAHEYLGEDNRLLLTYVSRKSGTT
jgi:zinc protease